MGVFFVASRTEPAAAMRTPTAARLPRRAVRLGSQASPRFTAATHTETSDALQEHRAQRKSIAGHTMPFATGFQFGPFGKGFCRKMPPRHVYPTCLRSSGAIGAQVAIALGRSAPCAYPMGRCRISDGANASRVRKQTKSLAAAIVAVDHLKGESHGLGSHLRMSDVAAGAIDDKTASCAASRRPRRPGHGMAE